MRQVLAGASGVGGGCLNCTIEKPRFEATWITARSDRTLDGGSSFSLIGPGGYVKIGIIGAGNIGGTLTRRFRALGHEVSVANSRGPETLASLAKETGARAVTVREAAHGQDVVVVTIPEKSIPQLRHELGGAFPTSTVVVDTGNYYPRQRDGRIVDIESGKPESRWVSQQLGHPVIKAFNNIYAKHLMENGKPKGAPGRIALPVAGDDAKSKNTIMRLVDELGFDPVDAGTLDESWRQQPGSPVYGTDKDAAGVRQALAAASQERPKDFTADKQ